MEKIHEFAKVLNEYLQLKTAEVKRKTKQRQTLKSG